MFALLIILFSALVGVGLGIQLRSGAPEPGMGHAASPAAGPETEDTRDSGAPGGHETAADPGTGGHTGEERNYVKINRQLIVPVVHERETRAVMLFELALDVPSSMTEAAYSAEPRLRDAFMRELFEMSFTGAFLTTYTDDRVVVELRERLRNAARDILGPGNVSEVLILDIIRQEM